MEAYKKKPQPFIALPPPSRNQEWGLPFTLHGKPFSKSPLIARNLPLESVNHPLFEKSQYLKSD